MIKLIGHHYNKDKGVFETFSVEVKETSKQFSKLHTRSRLYDFHEHWSVFPKNQLNKLREVYRGYSMFNLQENLAFFQELVIADLEQISIAKKIAHDESLELLRRAQKASESAK